MSQARVLGIAGEQEPVSRALAALQDHGYRVVETFAPFPSDELLAPAGGGESPVRFYTLAGGILGGIAGFSLAAYSAAKWGLITGGKPILSVPPFLLIAFEITMLFAGLLTVLGFVIHSGVIRSGVKHVSDGIYDPRFSGGHFGVLVQCEESRSSHVQQLLRSAGVGEVRVSEAAG